MAGNQNHKKMFDFGLEVSLKEWEGTNYFKLLT